MTQAECQKYAQKKYDIALHIAQLRTELADLQRLSRVFRAEKMLQITEAVNEGGKPLYSNAEKREAALALIEQSDAEQSSRLERIEEIERELPLTIVNQQYAADLLQIGVAFPTEIEV